MPRGARCAVILSLAKDLALPVSSSSSFAVFLPLVTRHCPFDFPARHGSLVTVLNIPITEGRAFERIVLGAAVCVRDSHWGGTIDGE